MKILIVAGGIVKAGVSQVISLLSKEWSCSHEVYISTFKSDDFKLDISATPILKGIIFKKLISSQVWHLYKLLKTHDFDKIYGFSEDANYPLILAARMAGLEDKVILSVHNPVQKFSKRVSRRVLKQYKYAYKIIAVSNGVREGLILMGVPKEKITFIPNPIDLNAIRNLSYLKPEIEFDSGAFNIVALGRLHKHKGFDLLLEAFAKLPKKEIAVKLWIIGGGEEKALLESISEKLHINDSVCFTGPVSNPYACLTKADMFVLSSRLEGWPLALMEAMACGLPVIAFDCPNGPNEIIQDKKNGLLVNCESIDELMDGINELILNNKLRTMLSIEAKERVKDFAVSKIAENWLMV